MKDLTVIIPCLNESPEILYETYTELHAQGATVIVVDDGGTMDLDPSIPCVSYTPQIGYGYAIKCGIKHAATEFICTMDGDGQHTVSDVKKMYTVFKLIPNCSMLIGCRWNLNERRLRWFGRKVINFIASLWAKHYLVDLNSGLRIFRRDLAVAYNTILCDTFSFTTSLTMSIVTDGYKTAWFPIDVQPRAGGKSHVKLIRDGLVTLFYIFWIGFALRTRKLRAWKRKYIG